MNLQDIIKLLRTRWIIVCVTVTVTLLGAIAYSLLTTPLYQASTRLFVSTSASASLSEAYQGNRYSQDRVASYAELLMGSTLAQRTIDKLGLDMSSEQLRANVSARTKPGTVLLNVDVLDKSPVQARDIANTMADEFVTMINELETPAGGASADSRVVVEQRASISDSPVVPKTSRNVVAGLVLGIVLGIALAIVRDMLDNTVKDRKSIESITGVGLVGSIPFDKERRNKPAITFDGDNSAIAEAFRKLRTNLQFLAVDNPPRVIVITSSAPAEGKSTTAINIALALAEASHNVLLIDGDMRRPTLHKYLGLVGQVGFSTVLSGRASLDEALQKSAYAGLTVLTSGTVPPNPSELLASQSARKLLNDVRGQFDYVIVDSTPVLAVTDAAILAASADGALVAARFGHTKHDQLAHAIGNLEDVGASLLGSIFTMSHSRGGSSYRYHYSYYGESAEQRPAGSKRIDPPAPTVHSQDPGEMPPTMRIAPDRESTGRRRRKPEAPTG